MRTAAAAHGSHDGLALFLFAAAYLVAYGYGSLFSQAASAPLWFPDSVLLCALLLAPQNKWWPYFVIAVPMRFIPALHEGTPQWFVAATSVNDMFKAALGAYLLRRVVGRPLSLGTLREFAIYLAIVVVLTDANGQRQLGEAIAKVIAEAAPR